MGATTLKLADELKSRITPLAASEGVTPHAWMVRALGTAVEQAERRASFVAAAVVAEAEVEADGKALRADDVHAYLRERLAGNKTRRPRAVKR